MAFTTVSDKKEEPKKGRKKKEIACFRCKKISQYASECEEELPPKAAKKEANMLILDKDSSVELEQYGEEDQDNMGQSESGHDDDKAEEKEVRISTRKTR